MSSSPASCPHKASRVCRRTATQRPVTVSSNGNTQGRDAELLDRKSRAFRFAFRFTSDRQRTNICGIRILGNSKKECRGSQLTSTSEVLDGIESGGMDLDDGRIAC